MGWPKGKKRGPKQSKVVKKSSNKNTVQEKPKQLARRRTVEAKAEPLECGKHPNYQGKRIPRNGCRRCEEIYHLKTGKGTPPKEKIVELPIDTCPTHKHYQGKREPRNACPNCIDIYNRNKFGNSAMAKQKTEIAIAKLEKDKPTIETAKKIKPLGQSEELEANQAVSKMIDTILAKQFPEIKKLIDKLVIRYETIYVKDTELANILPCLIQILGFEGWSFQTKFYDSCGNEGSVYTRIVQDNNPPAPDFSNKAVITKYKTACSKYVAKMGFKPKFSFTDFRRKEK